MENQQSELTATPWMSVRDVACLQRVLVDAYNYEAEVFEWGAGGSTLYFERFAKSWQSMEHDKEWAEKVWQAGGNVALGADPVAYCDPFEKLGKKRFDLILIDGPYREICIHIAQSHLKEKGLAFVHDARRRTLEEAADKCAWKMRIGDDLIVMATKEPVKRIMKILRKFELRRPHTGSYTWHPSHWNDVPASYNPSICGIPYARTV